MDKKEKLIIELKKENKNLKQHLKDSERWDYISKFTFIFIKKVGSEMGSNQIIQ